MIDYTINLNLSDEGKKIARRIFQSNKATERLNSLIKEIKNSKTLEKAEVDFLSDYILKTLAYNQAIADTKEWEDASKILSIYSEFIWK